MNAMTVLPNDTIFTSEFVTPISDDSYFSSNSNTISMMAANNTGTSSNNTTSSITLDNKDMSNAAHLTSTINTTTMSNKGTITANTTANNMTPAPATVNENKLRKRTRASPEQLAILERTFAVNPSPNHRIREQLSHELGMSERSIQIWFQNRRAKVKTAIKRSNMMQDEALKIQYYASQAATAACQAAIYYEHQRNHSTNAASMTILENPIKTHPELYYYYYYYYFNQQQQQQKYHYNNYAYHPYTQQYNQCQRSSYPGNPDNSQSMLPSFSSCTTSPPPATFLESIFPLPLQSFTPMPTNDNHVDNSSSETTKSVPRQFFNWPSFLQSQLPSVKSQIAPSARARAHTVEPYVSNSSNNQKLIYDRGMSANPTATAVKQLQQSAGCNIETTTNTVNVTSGIHALYASSEQQQHDENFTDLLLTQKLSSVSPTSPFSIALIQQQQQFDTLSVYNNEGNNNSKALDTLLHYSDLQRESQPLSCWSNLSFYNDEYSNLTLTPTTPPFGNNDSKLAMSKSAFTYPFDKLAELQYSSFSAEILHIGTWKRMTFQTGDLLCQFNKKTELFTWRIRDGPCYFKMEFPQSILQSISLQLLNERAGWARLEVTLTSTDSISFYMEKKVATGGVSNNPADANEDSTSVDQSATATATNIWVQCIDYTEDKQASLINIHQLDGPALALKSELALLAEESEYVASLLIKE